jgi:predicted Zn-dependent peptidase
MRVSTPVIRPSVVPPPVVRVLDNGLTVVLDVDREQPRVAARVVARWGAADDPADATGLAHLVEHLVVNKGTRKLGVVSEAVDAELQRRISAAYRAGDRAAQERLEREAAALAVPNELKQAWGALGGKGLNASTSHDRTSYTIDVPASHLDAWAAIEADRFGGPVFRTFGTEVGTVLQEIARSGDSPDRATWGVMRDALWEGHPYGRAVLGSEAHVASATPDSALEYFHAGYGAANLVACLAGDLDVDETLKLLAGTLGALPSGVVPPRVLPAVTPLKGVQRVELAHQAEPEMRLAWATVPAAHPDRPALALADMLLDNRATGLLGRRLVHPQRVRGAGSGCATMRGAGAFIMWGRPLDGQTLPEVEGLLLEELASLQRGEFEETVMKAIVRNAEVDRARRLEEPGPRASTMVQAVAWGLDPGAPEAWLEAVRAVTPDDVVRVAKQYLGPDRLLLHRTRGDPAAASPVKDGSGERVFATGQHSPFFHEITSMPGVLPTPQVLVEGADFERRDAAWGRLAYAPYDRSGIGRLVLRLDRGLHHDSTWGHRLHLLTRADAGAQSHTEWDSALYGLATHWGVSPARFTTRLSLQGPDEALDDAVALLAARLREPKMAADQRTQRLEELLARRREGRESREVRASALDRFVLRGTESEYLNRAPSDQDVLALVQDDLVASVGPLRTEARVVQYVGPRSVDGVLSLVAGVSGTDTRTPQTPPVRYLVPSADRVLLAHQSAAQARVAVLCPGPPHDTLNDPVRRIFEEILGGSANLFFQEIRESRGLAYSTGGSCDAGWRLGDADVMWAVTACDVARAAEVAQLMVSLLRDADAVAARFTKARAARLARDGAHRVRPRSTPATLEAWRARGILSDPRPGRRDAWRAMGEADLRAYHDTWRTRPLTVTVLGDLSQVDESALASIGPVTTLATDDLFSY